MKFMRGAGFRVAGLVLGILAMILSVVGVVMSAIGLHKAHQCKHCKMEGMYK